MSLRAERAALECAMAARQLHEHWEHGEGVSAETRYAVATVAELLSALVGGDEGRADGLAAELMAKISENEP